MNLFLRLLLILAALPCFSQINYESGYFISNNGIKTECQIKNLAWKNNPAEFDFKLTPEAEPQKGLKKNVSEFYVNGYKFVRYDVLIDRSSASLSQLSNRPEPQWQKEVLFLKVLVEGKMSLYEYKEENLVKYFYTTANDGKAQQLLYREYESEGSIRKNNAFRQDLYNLMKDAKSPGEFEKLRHEREDLVKLFRSYNGDTAPATNLSGATKGALHIKVTAGAAIASLKVDAVVPGYNYDFGGKTVFDIGAEVEYILPFNNNKWAVFTAPYVESYSAAGTNQAHAINVKYTSVNIPIGARHYMFLNDKSKLFINAAYVLGINSGDSYLEYKSNFTTKLDIGNFPNLSLGAGYCYGPFSAELRYGIKRQLFNYSGRNASYTTLGLLLGYKLL